MVSGARPRALRWAALLTLGGAAACATRGDVDFMVEQHESMTRRQAELESRVATLEQTMANLERLLQGIRADFRAELGGVAQGLSALESAMRGVEVRIDRPRIYVPPAPEPQPGDTTAGAGEAVDPIALYNSSLNDYHQGRLDLARQGFQEYLRLFPSGINASDAQYWLGAIDYDRRDFRASIETLRQVVNRYADSAKAPLALRKIGDAWRALGEDQRARAAYRELIERYPDSQEAEGARREIGT